MTFEELEELCNELDIAYRWEKSYVDTSADSETWVAPRVSREWLVVTRPGFMEPTVLEGFMRDHITQISDDRFEDWFYEKPRGTL